jgi:hypothetical protein
LLTDVFSTFGHWCFFDPDTDRQTIFFHMTLLSVEGIKRIFYMIFYFLIGFSPVYLCRDRFQ